VIDNLQDRMNGPGFGVIGAIHQASDAGVNQRTGTHGTGLNCSKERALAQAMITDVSSGFAQGDDLGVGRGVIVGEVAIPAAADDLPVADDDGADGNLARVERALGGTESLFHAEFVGVELEGSGQSKPAWWQMPQPKPEGRKAPRQARLYSTGTVKLMEFVALSAGAEWEISFSLLSDCESAFRSESHCRRLNSLANWLVIC